MRQRFYLKEPRLLVVSVILPSCKILGYFFYKTENNENKLVASPAMFLQARHITIIACMLIEVKAIVSRVMCTMEALGTRASTTATLVRGTMHGVTWCGTIR
jgi:hypothetical protein